MGKGAVVKLGNVSSADLIMYTLTLMVYLLMVMMGLVLVKFPVIWVNEEPYQQPATSI